MDDGLTEVRAGLTAGVEGLCELMLGKPTSKVGGTWRWGRKGSLSVAVRGPHKGQWFDHEAGIGGDMLGLIRRERGGDFPATLEWGRSFLGMGSAARPERVAWPVIATPASNENEDAARIERARRFWIEAVPVAGTLGEQYLVEARQIPVPADGWPDAVRFHPARQALVVAATTAAGEVQAVQLVHLTANGRKRDAEEGRPVKQSFGPQDGAVVRLPGEPSALLVAEGPETGLTVWAATGRNTWIALGSMGKVELPPLRQVVVIADDDPRDTPAAKSLRKAIARWRSKGRSIAVATPWLTRRFDKSDFNDLVRSAGLEAVRARIALALKPQGPPPGKAAVPVATARLHLEAAMRSFFDKAQAHDPALSESPPPVSGIRGGVGLGKSDLARRQAARVLAELRARGDRRCIVFGIPRHALAEEQARRFEALPEARAAGLRAALWRGREAPDPLRDGHAMCDDLAAVREAQSVRANPETAACKSKAGVCPFFETCGYQRQKRQTADLWFVPHEIIFSAKPKAIPKVAILVIDEAIWAKGLEGVDGPPVDMTVATLGEPLEPHERFNALSARRLRSVHYAVLRALEQHPDGPLRRDILLLAGLNGDTGKDGRALSFDRLRDADIHPGMAPEARRLAVHEARQNRTALRCARFFTALRALLADGGPAASGWALLVTLQTPEGPVRVLRLRGRREVGKHWQVPTLHLDALLNPDLLRPYWPQIEVTAEIEATTPHMRVRQLQGRDWAQSALIPDRYCEAQPGEAERRLKNADRLRAVAWREARRVWPGRVLIVAQKGLEDYWRAAGPIPANIEIRHHNGISGLDTWGPAEGRAGVVLLVVIGRTQPRPGDVERLAEALTGTAIVERVSRYQRRDAAVHLADGTALASETDYHPDPVAEGIRWAICEGELIQVIGRGRGVNRTSDNPLEVLVLTNTPLPTAVDQVLSWDDLAPTPVDLMLALGGVASESPSDAARCYPGLWPSTDAAKKAAQRGQWGTFSIRELSNGECPPLRQAVYQRAGARQRPAGLVFDPHAVPPDKLRDWLEDKLGPLTVLEVNPPAAPASNAKGATP
jgi:putative DNA primase/helicase